MFDLDDRPEIAIANAYKLNYVIGPDMAQELVNELGDGIFSDTTLRRALSKRGATKRVLIPKRSGNKPSHKSIVAVSGSASQTANASGEVEIVGAAYKQDNTLGIKSALEQSPKKKRSMKSMASSYAAAADETL